MARRLYSASLQTGPVKIIGPEAHHARAVLRLSEGDAVEVFDGAGNFGPGLVTRAAKSELEVRIETVRREAPRRPRIVLATAVPKFAHQEVLVRMATEIGVATFQPVISSRSSVRETFRPEKWSRWALEACKQCGRNTLPEIREALPFASLEAAIVGYDVAVLGDPAAEASEELARRLRAAGTVLVLVGPEGGFTPEETAVLRRAGALGLRAGLHTLRIETAGVALAAVAACLAEL